MSAKSVGLVWAAGLWFLVATGASARGDEIHRAAEAGDLEKVKALLAGDAGLVGAKDMLGRTALHFAAEGGKTEVAELLLSRGADPNAQDTFERTPLHLAQTKEMTALLVKGKADVNAKGHAGRTALHLAAEAGRTEVAAVLLTAGADVNATDSFLDTPLHLAANKDLAELLLSKKANVNARTGLGETPLASAAAAGRAEVAEVLLAHGADAKAETARRETVLHYAARGGSPRVVELLLAKGAAAAAEESYDGNTPLDWAVKAVKADAAALIRRRLVADLPQAAAGGADAKVLLRHTFAKGGRITYRLEETIEGEIRTDKREALARMLEPKGLHLPPAPLTLDRPGEKRFGSYSSGRLRIDTESEGPLYRLRCQLAALQQKTGAGRVLFDTEREADRARAKDDPKLQSLVILVETPIKIEMKPTGEVLSIDDDELREKMKKIERPVAGAEAMKRVGEDLLTGRFVQFPEKALSRGETWPNKLTANLWDAGRLTVAYAFTLEAVYRAEGERRAWLSVRGTGTLVPDPDLKKQAKLLRCEEVGDVVFSVDRGRLVSSKIGGAVELQLPGDEAGEGSATLAVTTYYVMRED